MRTLTIVFLLVGLPLLAQNLDYGATIGYQDVDLEGNEGVYRTQVDEDSGLAMQALWLNLTDPDDSRRLFDHLRFDASGFGASPHGRISLAVAEAETYKLKLSYQRFSQYSQLPNYANPLENQNIFPGQHQWDRTRENLDLEIRFLPQARFQPLLGLRMRDHQGPGQTTFTVGGDEFLLESQLDESEREAYAGLSFQTTRWHGELVSGVRKYQGRDLFALVPGAGSGNSSGTIFGHEISLDDLERTDRTDVDTPVTRLHLSGRLHDTTRVLASFVHADADADSSSSESLAGDLVSFRLRGLFGGRTESARTKTQNPSWRGDFRFEAQPSEQVEINARLMRSHREMDGVALISTVFLDATTFGGNALGDFSQLVEANSSWEREDTQFAGNASLRLHPSCGLRLGWSSLRSQSLITADLAEIIIPLGQDGTYQRSVTTYDLTAFYKIEKLSAELSWSDGKADRAVLRSDFLDRDVMRFRIDAQPWKFLQIHGVVRDADYSNDTELVNYDGSDFDYNLAVDVQPLKRLNLHLAYGGYELDTDTLIRRPETLQYEHSLHNEDGISYEGNVEYRLLGKHILAFDYSRYENEGSLPFESKRWQMRLEWALGKQFAAILEGGKREYRELGFQLADWQADQVAVLLRVTN